MTTLIPQFDLKNGGTTPTGAVNRPINEKLSDVISDADFGVVGNGITDDTTALQNAINAAYGKILWLTKPSYLYSNLTIADTITIVGAGKESTIFSTSITTGNAITITTTKPVVFESIFFTSQSSMSSGSLIKFNSTGTNQFSVFDNCTISFSATGIEFVDAALWNINNCYFSTAGVSGSTGILLNNSLATDSGDVVITGTTFYSSTLLGTFIHQTTNGGLRFVNNKFLYGATQILCEYSVSHSDLLISNSSFEGFSVSGITLNVSGSGSISNVQITTNEFAVSDAATGIYLNAGTTPWIYRLLIESNVFGLNGTGSTGINLAGVTDSAIGLNVYNGPAGTTGIFLGAQLGGVSIQQQIYNSIPTPIGGANIAQNGTTAVEIHNVKGNFTAIAAGGTYVFQAVQTLQYSTAMVMFGGVVQTVGSVNGLYLIGGTNTVVAISAVANFTVTVNAPAGTITITNNTGQTFNGKVTVIY